MESIFAAMGSVTKDDVEFADNYEARVKALIADAVDYNNSDLSPDREESLKYYYGESPALSVDDPNSPISGSLDSDAPVNRSTAVSTDVRDTVMAIMPSLMRIFSSSENVAELQATRPEFEEGAKQATTDVLYTFWEENDGFLMLHNLFKDALTSKVGVVRWWSDENVEVKRAEFRRIEVMELNNLIEEYAAGSSSRRVEVIEMSDPDEYKIIDKVVVQYIEVKPVVRVEAVPPENFRVSRRARSVKGARIVGCEELVPASDIIKMGYDKEMVREYVGHYQYYNPEESIRTPGIESSTDDDMVVYGEYYIRIDQDGDGVEELHRIRTIGGDYDILEDDIVDYVNFAVFCGDPRPHTVVGDSVADLVKDIQNIKTQLLRGALDNISASMYPDLAVNESLVNMEDVMSDGWARVIRTKTDPAGAIRELRASFNGSDIFNMMGTMDMIRQSRTGISEASKGVDPKALQSTNLMGIDAIVTGAQERIELIARILAETGFKDMMQGIFREIVRNPNRNRTIRWQGKWISLDPSLYDPNMTVSVNPSLGRGSDITKMTALNDIQQTQMMIMQQMGINNPFVTPEQYLNTLKDKLSMVNIKNTSRYFNDITPEIMQQISGPKEPSPEDLLAKAELEKVKKDIVVATAEQAFKREKLKVDDDFRRDQLGLKSIIDLMGTLSEYPIMGISNEPVASGIVDRENVPNE